jgi:excisionase family DNA binding protein
MNPVASDTAPRLFTIDAAGEYLRSLGAIGITKNCIRTMIASGGLPHIKLGKRHYVSKNALDAYIASHERRR